MSSGEGRKGPGSEQTNRRDGIATDSAGPHKQQPASLPQKRNDDTRKFASDEIVAAVVFAPE
jgi:hypothetical protein